MEHCKQRALKGLEILSAWLFIAVTARQKSNLPIESPFSVKRAIKRLSRDSIQPLHSRSEDLQVVNYQTFAILSSGDKFSSNQSRCGKQQSLDKLPINVEKLFAAFGR